MTVKATIKVVLGLQGPILCKATASSAWGIDATFDRDYKGVPYIDRSHIKGKLREALAEIGVDATQISSWLGAEGDRETGALIISDFYCSEQPSGHKYEKVLTRTRMDKERGVVEDAALLFMENAFPPRRRPYEWSGKIKFFSKSDQAAKKTSGEVIAGFKWISAFGSGKSVGFGRLLSVAAELACEQVHITASIPDMPAGDGWLSVTIKACDPLIMGGIKRKVGYMESETIISGSMIKGALAVTLNMICGVDKPFSTAIDSSTAVAAHYPALANSFSSLRFAHAFPSVSEERPVTIPLSAVLTAEDNRHFDVAFCKVPQTIGGKAPTFQTDWKLAHYPPGFGWAFPRKIFKTRTAIDPDLRRAEEGQMFTYQYVCPQDSGDREIIWRGLVWLPEKDRARLQAELIDALPRISRIGKRRSRVKISIVAGRAVHAQKEHTKICERCIECAGLTTITLQTDSLIPKSSDKGIISDRQGYDATKSGL